MASSFNSTLGSTASNTLFPRAWSVTVDNLNVSALDIEFSVLRSIKAVPNKCVLTLWNLNPDHRAQMLKRNKPNPTGKLVGVPVQIDAGYIGNTFTIFNGDLREVVSQRQTNDWKTILSGDDGGRAFRESRINQQFSKGTLLSTVIQQCASAMNVGIGNVATATSSAQIASWGATLPGSLTLSGRASQMLDQVLKSAGLTWSIQDGAIQVLPKGQALGRSAILISADTGLLDSPEASIDSTVSLGNPQQFAAGARQKVAKPPKPKDPSILKIHTLLIPGMVPGQLIQLKSQAFSGTYVLTECRYIGRSWAPNDWRVEAIARVSN